MGNSYFQFKQFRINQDKTAMKVCTDSCILGAYIAPSDAKTILDIGTGTGLLAMMVAQKTNAKIDAIEIEDLAFEQAKENVASSPWSSTIHLYHSSIQEFATATNQTYDLIISNPPFYKNQLKSPNAKKNIAHHSEQLSFEELTESIGKLLAPDGKFIFILPEAEFNALQILLIQKGLYCLDKLFIKDRMSSPIFRIIGTFQKSTSTELKQEELIIKDDQGGYTEHFKSLLNNYYLNL